MPAPVSAAIPTASPRRPPPLRARGLAGWVRANLLGDVHQAILTVLVLCALILMVPPIVRWAGLATGSLCTHAVR